MSRLHISQIWITPLTAFIYITQHISYPHHHMMFVSSTHLKAKELMDVLKDGRFLNNHLISISNSYSLHRFLSFQTLSPHPKSTSQNHIPPSAYKRKLQYQALNKSCRKIPIWDRHHWIPSRRPGVRIVLVVWVFILLFLEVSVLFLFHSHDKIGFCSCSSSQFIKNPSVSIFSECLEPCSLYPILFRILNFPTSNPVCFVQHNLQIDIFSPLFLMICKIFRILVLFWFSIFSELKFYCPVYLTENHWLWFFALVTFLKI